MSSRSGLARHRTLVSFVALVVGMSGVVAAVPAQTALADTAAQIAAVKKDIHDADAKLAALETKAEQASERYNQARVQLGDVSHRLL
ncbi:MAG: hypothetical protein QOG52_2729, partial [Frankiaceae bacterium]|nr:hypothetical protein [Frankiaceae bacterium]